LSPEQWTDEQIATSKIGLNEIGEKSRLVLLNRLGAQPAA
jgi:hypothetical protein